MKKIYSVLNDTKAMADLMKQGYTYEQLAAVLTKHQVADPADFKFVPPPGRKKKK